MFLIGVLFSLFDLIDLLCGKTHFGNDIPLGLGNTVIQNLVVSDANHISNLTA